jgi:uncharacterized membrane protein YhaH (DUF805 family)
MGKLTARDWLDPRRLYDPRVPAGRLIYFWGGSIYPLISIFVVAMFLAFLEGILGYYSSSPFLDVFLPFAYFGSILIAILVTLRRLKDLDKSGWYLLLMLIPLINIGLGLMLLFAEGKNPVVEPPIPDARGDNSAQANQYTPKYCKDCGEELLGDARFCMQCGTMVPSPKIN